MSELLPLPTEIQKQVDKCYRNDVSSISEEDMEIAIKVLKFWMQDNPEIKEAELLENTLTVLKYYYFREYEYFEQYEGR